LSVLIGAKDGYTYGHQEHCAAIANVFYKNLPNHLRKKVNRRRLIKAAKLHDIGKLFISDAIINKPSKLTDEEYEIIKQHAAIGAEILNKTSHTYLSNIAFCHHEWINGAGYYHVRDEHIPLEAKIISICDAFSALISNRPYRKGTPIDEAFEIIKQFAGTQFDEELVGYFAKINYLDLMSAKKV
jgi:HD-GYP domain-containing protein (c-di-GMP phosphodiesterase class II)